MNIVFMGTPQFAVPCLNSLVNSSHKIVAVVTQPDRPKGRSKKPVESPVKRLAVQCGLTVLQPERINKDEDSISFLEKAEPDIIVTAAFGQILSGRILSIPKLECINVHTSLLPKYRGAAPINRAIINGESETGISIIKMVKAMDAGDIIEQTVVEIMNDENADELEERLADLAVEPLLKTIDNIEKNGVECIKQDETKVTLANKLEKNEGIIDWNCDSGKIHNLVRGLVPWPCAFTYFHKTGSDEGKRIIVKKTCFDSECDSSKGCEPGVINKIADKGLLVATANGSLWITLLQPEGKRVMDARDYINGHGIKVSDYFSTQ